MKTDLNTLFKWLALILLLGFLWFIVSSYRSIDNRNREQQQQKALTPPEKKTQIRERNRTLTPERKRQQEQIKEASELGFR